MEIQFSNERKYKLHMQMKPWVFHTLWSFNLSLILYIPFTGFHYHTFKQVSPAHFPCPGNKEHGKFDFIFTNAEQHYCASSYLYSAVLSCHWFWFVPPCFAGTRWKALLNVRSNCTLTYLLLCSAKHMVDLPSHWWTASLLQPANNFTSKLPFHMEINRWLHWEQYRISS